MCCEADLGEADTPEDSHGICRRCYRQRMREIPLWQRIKATAKVDGWSAVFGWGTIYAAMGLWVLALVREGLSI
jgi:hypothetical protein